MCWLGRRRWLIRSPTACRLLRAGYAASKRRLLRRPRAYMPAPPALPAPKVARVQPMSASRLPPIRVNHDAAHPSQSRLHAGGRHEQAWAGWQSEIDQ
jgi:hypothetical protein